MKLSPPAGAFVALVIVALVPLFLHPADAGEQLSPSRNEAVRRLEAAGSTEPLPIRIHVEYQGLDTTLSNASQALLKLLVSEATSLVQQHLSVRGPTHATLLVPPMCTSGPAYKCLSWYPDFQSPSQDARSCGWASINPEHILSYTPSCAFNSNGPQVPCKSVAGGVGYSTDLYLYVTAYSDSCSSGAASSAMPCLLDPSTNRPLMGSVNVCPDFLARADPHNLLGVIVHEMVHTLGFISSMMPFFINDQGKVLPQEQVLRTATVGGRAVQLVVTPQVVQEVRAHFNCSEVEGAQLEVLGGASSSGSHWEYSLFQGEVMVASTTFSAQGDSPRLTRLTLALLGDSGWYLSNLTGAAPLTWGRNAGCDFLGLSCSEYSALHPDNPYFCKLSDGSADVAQGFSCTPSLKSQGSCRNVSFVDPSCGMLVARGATRTCLNATLQYGDAGVFGWYNGASSRCIDASYKFVAASANSIYTFPGAAAGAGAVEQDAVCFPMHCDSSDSLFVDVRGRSLRCSSGSTLQLQELVPDVFRSGSLGPCPDNAHACSTLSCSNCSAGGDCLEGRCVCMLGFSGEDCALDAVTGERLVGYLTRIPEQAPSASSALVSTLGVVIIVVCSLVGLAAVLGSVAVLLTCRSTAGKAVATQPPPPPPPPAGKAHGAEATDSAACSRSPLKKKVIILVCPEELDVTRLGLL